MKICLISAPTANQLHAALGELEAEGLQPEVVDLNRVYYNWVREPDHAQTDFCSYAENYFAARDFDVFGFSTVCSSYPLTLRIADAVKRVHPESVIVLGGPQASVVDVATMRAFPSIDLILRGEAEHTLPELVDALAQQRPLTAVPGLTFRQNQQIVRNPDAPLVMDLDALPFPDFPLFPDVRFARH